MNDASAKLATAATQVDQQASAVDSASGSLSSASSDLSGASSEVTALAAGSAQVATSAETVSTGISTASSGASTLDSTIGDLSTQATDLDTGIGNLQLTRPAARRRADHCGDRLGRPCSTRSLQIDTGANQLAADLAAGAERIPTLATEDLDGTEQVLSSPADVQVTIDNPANDLRPRLAPLFFGIAIWVFAIAVFLVMRPISGRALAGRASSWRISMAGWLPVVGIASLGSLLLLGIVWLGRSGSTRSTSAERSAW